MDIVITNRNAQAIQTLARAASSANGKKKVRVYLSLLGFNSDYVYFVLRWCLTSFSRFMRARLGAAVFEFLFITR